MIAVLYHLYLIEINVKPPPIHAFSGQLSGPFSIIMGASSQKTPRHKQLI
jgi:hypothetical protein